MELAQILMMITIAIYLVGMIGIGFFLAHRNRTTADFYLGGRRLGPFVTAMSAEASDMSSWLLMGLPGVAYISGLSEATWTAVGLAIGTYLNWLFVAKRMRRYTEVAGNAITLPDFFSNRYREKHPVLLGASALLIIVFFIPYTASGFAACGKLFGSLFGVNYGTAMLVSAVIIMLYTMLGGFLAASTTDFIQSIIMSVALVIVLLFGIRAAGGLSSVYANAKALPGYLELLRCYDTELKGAQNYSFISVASTAAWGLGYFGVPHILLRFMAIQEEKKLNLSRRIATVWVVISLGIAIEIGIIGYSVSKSGTIAMLYGSDAETVIAQIASALSKNGVVFAILAGLIIAGILASTMSTADSQLLAASSGVSQNILKGVLGMKLSERASMLVARVTLVVIAIIAAVIAKDPNSSVFTIVSFSWAGFGAAFGPVVLFSLFWKRTNQFGALTGMLLGGGMVFVWKYFVRPLGGAWDIYELLPAFLLACAAIVLGSLLTAAPDREILREFEQVANGCR